MPPELVDFLRAKDRLKASEVIVCIAHWLTGGLEARAVERDDPLAGIITATDIRAVYPHRELPDILPARIDVSTAMAAAANAGLLERVRQAGRASYRVTHLGRAVALALPDREFVGALRGFGRAARRPAGAALRRHGG